MYYTKVKINDKIYKKMQCKIFYIKLKGIVKKRYDMVVECLLDFLPFGFHNIMFKVDTKGHWEEKTIFEDSSLKLCSHVFVRALCLMSLKIIFITIIIFGFIGTFRMQKCWSFFKGLTKTFVFFKLEFSKFIW